MPKRVYLIRHGQTAWNAEGRWQGYEPTALNDVGLEQAAQLAAWFRLPLSAVYSSDLPRAHQTAAPLAATLGVPLYLDPRLREHHLGIFQGLTYEQIVERHPTEHAAMRADYFGYIIPGGESRTQLQARMFAAFREIAAGSAGDVALVSHGGAIKILLMGLFEEQQEAIRATHIDNTSITTLEATDAGGWRLLEMGATPHLSVRAHDSDRH